MHSYLKAIGFSEYTTKQKINELINYVLNNPSEEDNIAATCSDAIVEFRKEFCPGMGILIHGTYNSEDEIDIDYYFPYIEGDYLQINEEVSLEKRVFTNSFAGICDDIRMGVSLIFYLQNAMDYMNLCLSGEKVKKMYPVKFSALSLGGTILLPISKTEIEIKRNKAALENRNNLIFAARNGDEDAIESLTIEDLDLYNRISQRIAKEDVFSIVDNCFMPYGIECDQYTVIGDITDINCYTNNFTGEEIYNFHINCNDLLFNVVINKLDLLGEPEIGRRFKGTIWLQAEIKF